LLPREPNEAGSTMSDVGLEQPARPSHRLQSIQPISISAPGDAIGK
jgi:hypothetical protein